MSSTTKRRSFRALYWIGGPLLTVAAILLVARTVIRHQTSPEAMVRRLQKAMGPGSDSLYVIRVGSSHLSLREGTYVATGIEILPDTIAFRVRHDAGRRVRDRFSVQIASVRVTGLDVWGLLMNRVKASRAVADSVRLEISLDRALPVAADSFRRLPHEVFGSITQPFRVDSFLLEHAEFSYSERAIDGARPGTIRFANSRIGVYNLNNDPRGPNVPVVIEVNTMLAGSAPASGRFEYDFRAPKLNLDYRVSIGDLEAKRLNDMTVNLEGLRLDAGHLDTAWFRFRVKDNVANGEAQVLYRGLNAALVDKVSRDEGVTNWVRGLIANTFILHGHNRSDGDHRTRTVLIRGFERTPDVPFFKFVWFTLREGLFVTLKGESSLNPTATVIKRKPQ